MTSINKLTKILLSCIAATIATSSYASENDVNFDLSADSVEGVVENGVFKPLKNLKRVVSKASIDVSVQAFLWGQNDKCGVTESSESTTINHSYINKTYLSNWPEGSIEANKLQVKAVKEFNTKLNAAYKECRESLKRSYGDYVASYAQLNRGAYRGKVVEIRGIPFSKMLQVGQIATAELLDTSKYCSANEFLKTTTVLEVDYNSLFVCYSPAP